MEVVKLKINATVFERLIASKQLHISEVDIIQIEPDDYDYSDDEKWQEAKSVSTKAYKKLKQIEFELRNA